MVAIRVKLYRLALLTIYYINSKYLYRFLRHIFRKRLSNILIHITNKCNYNCRYCYVDRTKPALNLTKWLSVLKEVKRLGIHKICILGGEPFYEYDSLESLLNEAKRLGLKVFIYTNASLITEDSLKRLKEYNPVLVCKYDFDYDNYQYNTQQSKYTSRGIEDKIRLARSYGFSVLTFTILMKHNINKIGDIIEHSLKLGAFPAFERYLPVKDSYTNELFEIPDDDYSKAMEDFSHRISFKREYTAATRILGRSCSCYGNLLSIYPSGEVLPCPYLPEEASLGNIKNTTLKELYKIMRAKARSEYKINGRCKKCEHLDECSGGCFTYSFLKTGKYLPHCSIGASAGFYSYFLIDMHGGLRPDKL